MSENLDLVRSIYAAWERGDFGGSGEWVDPEIEFVVDGGPEPGRWTGLGGLIEGARTILSAWEDWRPEATQLVANWDVARALADLGPKE